MKFCNTFVFWKVLIIETLLEVVMKKLISLLSIISILLLVGCSESKNTNQTVKETTS